MLDFMRGNVKPPKHFQNIIAQNYFENDIKSQVNIHSSIPHVKCVH